LKERKKGGKEGKGEEEGKGKETEGREGKMEGEGREKRQGKHSLLKYPEGPQPCCCLDLNFYSLEL
jgi:hypothetical protein